MQNKAQFNIEHSWDVPALKVNRQAMKKCSINLDQRSKVGRGHDHTIDPGFDRHVTSQ